MAYLLIFSALLAGQINGYCGKKTSGLIKESSDAALFNCVRMFLCIIIGFLFVLLEKSVGALSVNKEMLLVSILAGLANASFVVFWLFAVRKNAYMTVEVALMCGSLIPTFGSAILYHEKLIPSKFIGFALLLIAVLLLASYNTKISGKMTFTGILFMVLAGIGEGTVGLTQQIYKFSIQPAHPEYTGAVLNFYTYVFVFAFLFLYLLVCDILRLKKGSKETVFAIKKLLPALVYITVMAACLFINSYFQTLATTVYGMSSQILYPFLKGGALVTATLMAAIFFKEKMTWRSILGTVIAFGGLICLNVLNF